MHFATTILSLCVFPWLTVAFSTCVRISNRRGYNSRLFGSSTKSSKQKRVVIIRHGCTYMNEYLSTPGSRWGDAGFTDIFEDPAQLDLFRDSPLSDRGIHQAKRLGARLGHLMEDDPPLSEMDLGLDQNVIREIDLIACSPLTRALQTTELSLVPHLEKNDDGCPKVPIVALPLASERVYLISDEGRSTDQLAKQFPCVNFQSDIEDSNKDCWWFTYDGESDEPYTEWRPNGEGQTYACKGEPEADFDTRMAKLYDWLESRKESAIALVCHWGVIDWLTGEDFENCEMKVIPFESMKRTGFMLSDEEAAELFAKGERTVIQEENGGQ